MIASILPDIDMSDSVKFGFQVWNTFMKSVYALLTESPSQFKDGEIWKAVQKINPYFITVGTIAVSLCFAMGLVKNQVDLKRDRKGFNRWSQENEFVESTAKAI